MDKQSRWIFFLSDKNFVKHLKDCLDTFVLNNLPTCTKVHGLLFRARRNSIF